MDTVNHNNIPTPEIDKQKMYMRLGTEVVPADLARKYFRELTAAQATIAELRKDDKSKCVVATATWNQLDKKIKLCDQLRTENTALRAAKDVALQKFDHCTCPAGQLLSAYEALTAPAPFLK